MNMLNSKFSKLSNFELLLEYRDRVKYDPCGSSEPEYERDELMEEVLARMALGAC